MKNLTVKSFVKEKVLSIFVSVFMLVSSTIGTITADDNEGLLTDNSEISIVDEQTDPTEPNTEPTETDTDPVEEDENLSTVDVTFSKFESYFIGLTAELTNTLDETDKITFTISDDSTIAIPIGEYTLKILSDNGTVAEYQNTFNISNENNTFDMLIYSVPDTLVVSPPILNEPTREGGTHYGESGQVTFDIAENSIPNEKFLVGFEVKINGETVSEDKITIENNSCIVPYENLTKTLNITCSAYYYVEIDSNEVGSDGSIIKGRDTISGNSEEKSVDISVNKWTPEIEFSSNEDNTIYVDYNQNNFSFIINFKEGTISETIKPTGHFRVFVNNKEVQQVFTDQNEQIITITDYTALNINTYTFSVRYYPDNDSYTVSEEIQLTVKSVKDYYVISPTEASGNNGWYTDKITLEPKDPFTKIIIDNITLDERGDVLQKNVEINSIESDGSIVINEETKDGKINFHLENEQGKTSSATTFTYKLDKTAPKAEDKKESPVEGTYKSDEKEYSPKFTKGGDWSVDAGKTQYFYQYGIPQHLIEQQYQKDNQNADVIMGLNNPNDYRYYYYEIGITETTSGINIDRINGEINNPVEINYDFGNKTSVYIKLIEINNSYYFIIATKLGEYGSDDPLLADSEDNVLYYGWTAERKAIEWINENIFICDNAGHNSKISNTDSEKNPIADTNAIRIEYTDENLKRKLDNEYTDIKTSQENSDYWIYNNPFSMSISGDQAENANVSISFNDEDVIIETDENGDYIFKQNDEVIDISLDENGNYSFNQDGRYVITISANTTLNTPDKGKVNGTYVSVVHIIDKTAPTIEKVEYSQSLSDNKDGEGLFDSILKTISFGFYNPDKADGKMTATVTAKDVTSGVEFLQMQFINEDETAFDFVDCDIDGYDFAIDNDGIKDTTTLIYDLDNDFTKS
ncbi:MAG: hypothetical protein LBM93_08510, partial [Oscillospiraceae bacterium]|nr:hypothetical protein [Oscillospiraceae bacterium]